MQHVSASFLQSTLAAVTLVVGLGASATAQSIDLSRPSGSEQTVTVRPGPAPAVWVINKLPNGVYTHVVSHEVVVPEPLTAPTVSFAKPAGAECQKELAALKGWVAKLEDAKDESEIPKVLKEGAGLAAKVEGVCRTSVQDAFEEQLARTRELVQDLPALALAEKVTVSVSRIEGAPQPKNWKLVLTTGPAGRWATSYGIGYGWNRDERYRSEETSQTGVFKITKLREPTGHETKAALFPAVFFTWVPANKENTTAFNWVFGIGANTSRAGVFGGGGWTIGSNVSLNVGLVYATYSHLHGRFTENQEIKENLTNDQLTETSVPILPSPFVALSFRFGSNPFTNQGEAKEKEAVKKEPEKKDAEKKD